MEEGVKINWKKVWDDFDEWCASKEEAPQCKSCGKRDYEFPDWDEQQKAIQRIVNGQLKNGR